LTQLAKHSLGYVRLFSNKDRSIQEGVGSTWHAAAGKKQNSFDLPRYHCNKSDAQCVARIEAKKKSFFRGEYFTGGEEGRRLGRGGKGGKYGKSTGPVDSSLGLLKAKIREKEARASKRKLRAGKLVGIIGSPEWVNGRGDLGGRDISGTDCVLKNECEKML